MGGLLAVLVKPHLAAMPHHVERRSTAQCTVHIRHVAVSSRFVIRPVTAQLFRDALAPIAPLSSRCRIYCIDISATLPNWRDVIRAVALQSRQRGHRRFRLRRDCHECSPPRHDCIRHSSPRCLRASGWFLCGKAVVSGHGPLIQL